MKRGSIGEARGRARVAGAARTQAKFGEGGREYAWPQAEYG